MEFKLLISVVAILISFIGYFIYLKSTIKGKTKPHAFSWFIWGVLTAIVFTAQLSEGAGLGAWITGTTALACFATSLLALKFGEIDFPLLDWICLFGAFGSLVLWYYLKDPTVSIVLITLIDFLALIPSIRKAYAKPWEENPVIFLTGGLKFFLSLLALYTFTVATALYPVYIAIINSSFVLLILIRRKQLTKTVK